MEPFSLKLQKLIVILVTLSIVTIEIAVSFNSALLPSLRSDLAISEQLAQATISATLVALAISGIIYGVLSQSYGRRPVILGGVMLFCLGALGSAIAPTVEWLLVARVVQGFGAGVGWIVGNAILKDLFEGDSYTKVMNQVHAVAGIVPAIAPSIGAYLAELIGWRLCLTLTFVLGIFTFLIKLKRLPETHYHTTPMTWRSLFSTYGGLFKNPRYLIFTTVKVLSVMLLFTESANIPLIFVEHLGVPSKYYGFYTIPVFLFYILGGYISAKFCRFYRVETILGAGFLCITASNLLILLCDGDAGLSAVGIQGFKTLTYFGWGLIFGNATAALISAVPDQAGAASAMMIALEMVFSALGIYGLGLFFTGSIVPLSLFMMLTSLLCLGLLMSRGRLPVAD